MSDVVTSSTADLVRRGQTGDKGAFGQLVERFQAEAYGLAYYHLGHREDALDVAQQAFLAAYLHLDSLTDPARFGGWLARIVANECLRWRRRRRPALSLDTPALIEAQQLPEPIFTPTTKAETGHDEPLTFEPVEAMVGRPLAAQLRDATLAIYSAAAEQARERGIIIADTKMEFGIIKDNGSAEGRLILIDELLTPDSSRFWDTETYQPGSNPPSYDKQYVRDYLSATGPAATARGRRTDPREICRRAPPPDGPRGRVKAYPASAYSIQAAGTGGPQACGPFSGA